MDQPPSLPLGVIPRPELRKDLERNIRCGGLSSYVFGPQGSGKTSLVLGILKDLRIPCIHFSVDKGTAWMDLCKGITSKEILNATQATLPPKGDIWGEHDIDYVAGFLIKRNVMLVLDNFENAQKSFIELTSPLGKHLSDSSSRENSPYAKLIIITSKNVYGRLYDAHPSIGRCLSSIEVPALRKKKKRRSRDNRICFRMNPKSLSR